MDALDEETKDNILRNIGELFPNVSELSFFRHVFDNLNWDLEKSLDTIKNLLEGADDEGSVYNDPPRNTDRVPSPIPELPNLRITPNPTPTSNVQPMSAISDLVMGTTSRNSVTNSLLYSSSLARAGAVPKSTSCEKKMTPISKALRKEKLQKAYNDGLKQKNPVLRIKSFALEGIKVMIIMRGCPGSGKTYLAQHLANSLSLEQSKALGSTVNHPVDHHIFSADDFWINPAGKYVFNSEYIEYAHRWNQKLVRQAASEGRSPIFVDNTHTRLWEMQAVATIAVEFGYLIEIIDSREVNKKWAFNVNELVRRNAHGVHYDAIKRMVERYELDVQPKHLFKTYNLSYQPNIAPPQRCLVTFSTPPSKNHMKIFNTRFHCAPMKDILALKSSEPENSVNVGPKSKSASRVDRTSSAAFSKQDPRSPVIYRATEFIAPKRNEAPVYAESDLLRPCRNRAPAEVCEFPEKDGNYSAPHLPQFPSTAPPSDDYSYGFNANHATNQYQGAQNHWCSGMQYPNNRNWKTQQVLSPAEYIWSNPHCTETTPASNAAETSLDLLLSMNEDIRDTTSNQPLHPKQAPTKTTDPEKFGVVDPQNGMLSNKPDSASDFLLSFEEFSQVTSKSSSVSNVNQGTSESSSICNLSQRTSKSSIIPSDNAPVGELATNTRVSPCKEVDAVEEASDDSDFSYEDIPITLPANACNEFGQAITLEYVLVYPDGSLRFQNSHDRLPVSLKEFVSSSKIEKLKNQLVKSAARQHSHSTVNKLMKPFSKSFSNVPIYSDDTLLINRNGVAPLELLSKSAHPSMNLGKSTGNEAKFDTHGLSSKTNSLGDYAMVPDRPVLPSEQHVPKSTLFGDSCLNDTYDVISLTSQEFVDKVWSQDLSNTSAEILMKSGSTARTPTSTEMVPPAGASTWSEPKEPEPIQITRTGSPKGQRSQVERTLTKKCDKSTDANYFEILSKAHGDALGNNDVVLFGNASSFQSSPSPPNQDGIKAIATHDKSSMTKSDESTDEIDSGVEILTKMFPDVSLDSLTDLFEKCQKNLYWTVNLLMDSGEEISVHFSADVTGKNELPPPSPLPQTVEIASEPSSKESLTTSASSKKLKKNRYRLTEEYLDLVKEFESNFILNEEHYSETLKKVRETKFGRPFEAEPADEPCASRDSTPPNDPESGSCEIWDDDEGDMSLVVSNDLIAQLQNKFGPIPTIYGSELVVKLPVSLARQIYSYTLDSICHQVEDEQNAFDLLIKEDEAFARKLQEESEDSRGAMSFQEIMDHEMALRAHEREQGKSSAAASETFASRLSQQLLAERFPNMDPVTLQNVLDVTNHSLHEATNLLASAGHVPVDPHVQEAVKNSGNEPTYTMSREESIEQANAYHEVASKLNDMRQLYFQKAKESFSFGNHAVALFYRELFNWYSDQIKASNAKAAKAMLHGNEGATTLDLHYLHVSEAVGVLDLFLDESIRQLNSRKMEIFIITGRGLHSLDGKSKLKPAIKLRLKQRGLKYGEVNPGMLKTVITKGSTVSYKLNGVQ